MEICSRGVHGVSPYGGSELVCTPTGDTHDMMLCVLCVSALRLLLSCCNCAAIQPACLAAAAQLKQSRQGLTGTCEWQSLCFTNTEPGHLNQMEQDCR